MTNEERERVNKVMAMVAGVHILYGSSRPVFDEDWWLWTISDEPERYNPLSNIEQAFQLLQGGTGSLCVQKLHNPYLEGLRPPVRWHIWCDSWGGQIDTDIEVDAPEAICMCAVKAITKGAEAIARSLNATLTIEEPKR